MSYVGDYALGATFYFNFETLFNNTLTSLTGGPSLVVYADNNVVQFSTGLTLTADFDAVVGTHNVQVVATGGNGFATGVNYCVRIAAGTVGGMTAVGRIVGEFSIEKEASRVVLGAAGSGLTALGDTRIANLDTTVSSRSTYAGGAVASVTGNVGGSVASVTATVNANVTKINGTTVNGDGSATPWGP